MKLGNTNDVVYKEVVVIGNGPSGIALSYMLSGNLPFLTSKHHPDEMLSMRLENAENKCLIKQNLSHLANGLEGRSTNPISLLFDCLLKPYADVGLEMAPLIEFKKVGVEIDHVVLGKGPPGGSWHKMDPDILTLSLGSWMALPEYPFRFRDSGEKRALASTVANYYVDYVRQMNLNKYFRNHAVVSNVVRLNKSFHLNELRERETEERLTIDENIPEQQQQHTDNTNNNSRCALTSFLNYVRGRKTKSTRCNKRPREQNLCQGQSPERKIRESGSVRDRSVSFSCDDDAAARALQQCDSFYLRNSQSLEFKSSNVPLTNNKSTRQVCDETDDNDGNSKNKQEQKINWLVESHDAESGESTTYSCKYLVLANGTSDVPNRLHISKSKPDPNWLFHDLRTLENHLDTINGQQEQDQDRMEEEDIEPVLIVGAGLSAADAIIATRARNIPVCHVFRNKLADLNRRLPENMYPEYHKVNQMMQDGGSTYPFYTAYPEYDLHSIDEASHSVILTSKYGEDIKLQVSFAVVLIGSRPDLTFLPPGIHFNLNKDSKRNKTTLQIDKMTHCVNGFENLFAVGPLAGDNFVRFIPGGAFAVVSQMYKNNSNYMAYLN